MKNLSVSDLLIVLALLLGAVSCTHPPTVTNQNSTPVQQEKRNPASFSAHLDQADMDEITEIITGRHAIRFQHKLLKLRLGQILVSYFDLRLEQIAKTANEQEMDKLFESKLYCKLWEHQAGHKDTEEQLVFALKIAKELNSGTVSWYYKQMSWFAKLDVARKAAMLQLYRELVSNELEICGREACVSEDAKELTGLQMNPLDNKAFSQFMKIKKGIIAAFSQITANELKPGECFDFASKRTPQAVAYDWKNRSWKGTGLPIGQFVFTYDDGPHAIYTRQIRETWAQAGMAKPTFFWLRRNADVLPEIVKELNEQGYSIGSHTASHADLGNLAKASSAARLNAVNKKIFGTQANILSSSAFAAWKEKNLDLEINQSVADLSAILGKPVRYFRLPYGAGVGNDMIGQRFQKLNLDHFFWRVDSLDWQDKNPESIRDRIVTQMKTVRKGIVLFHDIHAQSLQATKLLVEYLKVNPNFKAVPLQDLPGLQP